MSTLVIIGAGVMGDAYARAATETNLRWRTEIVGVCDTNIDAATALAWGLVLAVLDVLAASWFFTRVYRSAVRTGLIARYSAESVS